MKARGGRNLFGYSIGILVLDTVFPRIPGDIGHAGTFPFPVLYHKVRNAFPSRVVREGDPALLEGFVAGARALEANGVLAITTSCGFLAMFQRQLAEAVRVPVFTSALQLVPLVSRMLGPARAVGILTVESHALGPRHLAGAGITEDINVVIAGLERGHAFTPVLLDNETELDVDAARRENVEAAKEMVERHPEVGAIVLECTNMPPYASAIRDATGLPVFDITTLIRMVHAAVTPPVY
ncbi:MAG: aspartate/glutamate racemase family protein [Bacillati bacterium ANGP1]|uniref:Aspartate/glutamate racemase family protein n=1 Tax=Candidatus Segetimicrobium genomatis TaxID=2569760 RepID=A0A537JKN2_9BACT|nr:MAG: aspartate/glutamate racemase family protein [Terrabacteria group bacterium ANGP1]